MEIPDIKDIQSANSGLSSYDLAMETRKWKNIHQEESQLAQQEEVEYKMILAR